MKHNHTWWRHGEHAERVELAVARAMGGHRGEGFGRRGFGRSGEQERGGRAGGRRRMFEGSELRLVILLFLESEPRHGYDIIREIETRTGGAYAPSPGIVYPTLTLLEELGQVAARAMDGAKKLYEITGAGSAALAENRADAEVALARLDELRRRSEVVDAGPVFRAMSNLKAVLHQRLSNPPDKELLFAVADLIDEAARKIERL
jgi:DNA-binding PadR family transcriptional regulator